VKKLSHIIKSVYWNLPFSIFIKIFRIRNLRKIHKKVLFSEDDTLIRVQHSNRKDSNNLTLYLAQRTRLHLYFNGIQYRLDQIFTQYCLNNHPEIFEFPGWTIDIGANIGELSMSIMQRYPNQNFLIIEPSLKEMSAAKRNLNKDTVTFNSSALWKVNTTLKFYHANNTGDSSLLPKNLSAPSELVEARTLDSIVAALEIDQINLLKLEAEGAEPEILDGALITLMKTKFVAADLGPERGPNELPTYFECKSKLEALGFKQVSSYEGGRETYLFRNMTIN
jgi:FkbM family methyltransferase